MDTKTGFNHVYENIYFEARDRKCLAPQASVKPLLSQNGVRKRDVYRMYGIRVLTLATGLHPSCAFLEIFAICRTTLALHLSLFKKARIWRKDKVLSNCAQHSLAIQTASAFSLQLSEVLQLSSGIALLGTAELAGDSLRDFRSEASVWECAKIADFWLMNCVPERKLEP